MLWVIECIDAPDGTDRRPDFREAHFAHLRAHKDRIVLAGPLLDEERTRPVGSLLVVDFPTHKEAADFAADDPFASGGVFDSVIIKPFKAVDL